MKAGTIDKALAFGLFMLKYTGQTSAHRKEVYGFTLHKTEMVNDARVCSR